MRPTTGFSSESGGCFKKLPLERRVAGFFVSSVGGSVRLPQTKTAEEGVLVVAEAGSGGKCFQFFGITPAEDDVIGFERGFQQFGDFEDFATPLFLAIFFEATNSEIILVGFSFFVEQMSEFHGLEKAIANHRGAEAGAQAEEKH